MHDMAMLGRIGMFLGMSFKTCWRSTAGRRKTQERHVIPTGHILCMYIHISCGGQT